jgi:hypothetical protein
MGFPCWSGEHLPVTIVATILWLAYAVALPVALAWTIAKDKIADDARRHGNAQAKGISRGGGGSEYWHSTRPLIEKFWFPLVAHLRPQYWWFFIVEIFRKLWLNFLYLRGYRSDDGFNWKLSFAIYLVLEQISQQLLRPRVYKKANDTFVDFCSKQFLIVVLMLAMCSDSLERGAEGEAINTDNERPSAGLLMQILFGLPGLTPLLLNKLCVRLDRKTKDRSKEDAADGQDERPTGRPLPITPRTFEQTFDNESDGAAIDDGNQSACTVVRIHQEPAALTRLRQTRKVR